MQIAAGIHRLEAPLGERYVALYLLAGSRSAMLVDTGVEGSVEQAVLPYLRSLDLAPDQLRYIVCTHSDFDHLGGNSAARRFFPQALLLGHLLDQPMIEDLDALIGRRYGEFLAEHGYDDVDAAAKEYIRSAARPAPLDVAVTGGERVRLGGSWQVELVHTPGHSWGSLSVWDPRSRTMIVGDAVLGDGLTTRDGRPAFPPTYRYVQTYRATIDRLAAMDIDILGTAHYPLYRGPRVQEFLALCRGYTDRVQQAVLDDLAAHDDGAIALDIIERTHGSLGPWDKRAAQALMYPVVGHLEWLAESGTVRADRDGELTRWRIARRP